MITRLEEALNWAASIQQFAPVSEHHRRAVGELWQMLEPLGIKTALEVGTGEPPGLVVEMLRQHSIEAVGLDIRSGSDYHKDMHDLPFPDNSFDLVVARHSLEHVLIPYLAVMEMRRVSRLWLLAVVPTDSVKCAQWPDHLYNLSQEGWRTMWRHLGLRIERFEVGDHTEAGAPWTDLEWRFLLGKETH